MAAFLFTALITAVVGGISIYFTNSIGDQGKTVATRLAPLKDAAMEIKLTATKAHLLFEEIMAGDSSENLETVWNLLDKTLWYCNAILKGGENDEGKFYASDDPQIREKVETLRKHVEGFLAVTNERHTTIQKNTADGNSAAESFDKEFEIFVKEADEAKTLIYSSMDKGLADFESARKQSITWMIAVSLLALVIAVMIAIKISGSIVTPISESVTFANALAKGDMSLHLNFNSNDEFGELSRALERTATNLSGMIKEIRDNASSVASASEALFSVSTELTQGTKQMAGQSKSVAAASEEMANSINMVSAAAEEMSVNTSSVSTDTKQMSDRISAIAAAVEETSTSIGDISQSADEGARISEKAIEMAAEASKTMNVMGEAANDIGKVTEVIKRIAQQTNLLALNATIEAAAAGEAGKGFTVVSNEIKILANQSAQAAEDIASRIAEVQATTQNAVNVIAEVSATISNINDSTTGIATSVEQQSQTANEIASNVASTTGNVESASASLEELATGAQDMSQNTGKMVSVAGEVTQSIHEIDKSLSNTTAGVQQVNTSAKELSKLAGDLKTLVGAFKVE